MTKIYSKQFLGLTMPSCTISEKVSTTALLMNMQYWREQILQNCTYLLPNTRSTYTVHIQFVLLICVDLELTPSETYDITWNPRT